MITFSSDIGQELSDWAQCSIMAEEYFKTRDDYSQMQITDENAEWLYKHFPESLNVIKDDDLVIGFTFILLSTDDVMNNFLNKKISEQEIFDEFQKNYPNEKMSNIYLCASIISEKYRGKGFALQGFKKQISSFEHITALYSWPFSIPGQRLSEKISLETSIQLFIRDK